MSEVTPAPEDLGDEGNALQWDRRQWAITYGRLNHSTAVLRSFHALDHAGRASQNASSIRLTRHRNTYAIYARHLCEIDNREQVNTVPCPVASHAIHVGEHPGGIQENKVGSQAHSCLDLSGRLKTGQNEADLRHQRSALCPKGVRRAMCRPCPYRTTESQCVAVIQTYG